MRRCLVQHKNGRHLHLVKIARHVDLFRYEIFLIETHRHKVRYPASIYEEDLGHSDWPEQHGIRYCWVQQPLLLSLIISFMGSFNVMTVSHDYKCVPSDVNNFYGSLDPKLPSKPLHRLDSKTCHLLIT